MYKIKTKLVVKCLAFFLSVRMPETGVSEQNIYISFIPNLLTLVMYIPNLDKLGIYILNPIVCRIIKIYVFFDYICST